MAEGRLVLDTDILSAIMRQNPGVILKAQAYLDEHRQFTLSIITRFEILRGLKAKNATRQLQHFNEFCDRNVILPLTDDIVMKAADIYADLHQRGALIGDADILIAASAIVNDWGIVTNNVNHFGRIDELRIENWLQQ